MKDWYAIAEKIAEWLKEQVKDSGAKGVVCGMSGGIDSSVVAALCKKAFPEKSLGLIMPCESREQDTADAMEFAEKIGIKYKKTDLSGPFREMLGAIGEKGDKVAEGNLKARLRMCTLYFFANKLNYLVVGSGNRSELMLGYFTKHGDGAVDLLPLGGLLKSEVRETAKALNVPEKIVGKAPSADLWEGQTDEAELGMSYEEIDAYLRGKESEIPEKLRKRIEKNRHKCGQPKIFEK